MSSIAVASEVKSRQSESVIPEDHICRILRLESVSWNEIEPIVSADDFFIICEQHGVSALIYHVLNKNEDWGVWPPDLKKSLAKTSRIGVASDLLREHHLNKIFDAFQQRGVPCLVFKGSALSVSHYPIPGTRPRCDIDLFISISDITKARQTLIDLGFSIDSPVYKNHQFTAVRQVDEPDLVQVDVHWRILNTSRFARTIHFQQALDTSRTFPDRGSGKTLNEVDALLVACLHRLGSEKHDKNRLIWIYDIHLLVSAMTQEDTWTFARKALNHNVQDVCLDGLEQAKACFGTKIAIEILQALSQTKSPNHLADRFSQSSLALLIDDWKNLPSNQSRWDLLKELFAPSVEMSADSRDDLGAIMYSLKYSQQLFRRIFRKLTLK